MNKYAVVLCGGAADPNAWVTFVLASTDKRLGECRQFEVVVPPTPGRFKVVTKVDCRFPFTLQQRDLTTYEFHLSADYMAEVDAALIYGLGITL